MTVLILFRSNFSSVLTLLSISIQNDGPTFSFSSKNFILSTILSGPIPPAYPTSIGRSRYEFPVSIPLPPEPSRRTVVLEFPKPDKKKSHSSELCCWIITFF